MQKKQNGLLYFLAGFIAIAGWIISCILTVNLLVEFFKNGLFWSIVGALVGVIFDCSKVASLIWYLKTRFIPALILTISIIVLSIAASVGTLQVSSEKSAMQSPEYIAKQDDIDSINKQIEQKRALVKKQLSVNYITRSKETSKEIDNLILKKENLNSELREIQYSASGLSGAIFRAFSKIFEIDIYYIILLGNIFLAVLLETVISAFVIMNFHKKESNILIGQSNSNNGFDQVELERLLTKTVTNNDKVDIENFDNNLDQVLKSLKADFRKSGKSDKTILHFWDNGIRNKSEIGRLVKTVLGYKVSRQYVDQVLSRERPDSKKRKKRVGS